jgi:hypothetical protein
MPQRDRRLVLTQSGGSTYAAQPREDGSTCSLLTPAGVIAPDCAAQALGAEFDSVARWQRGL